MVFSRSVTMNGRSSIHAFVRPKNRAFRSVTMRNVIPSAWRSGRATRWSVARNTVRGSCSVKPWWFSAEK